MDTYGIRIPIETVGEDKLRTIYDSIKGNQTALQSLSPHLQGFVREVISGINETQNFDKALKNIHTGITGASGGMQELAGQFRLWRAEAKAAASQAKETGDAIQHIVPQMAAASAALRTLEGQMSLRAAERFLSMFQGMGPVLQAAFPVFGAIAFAEALGRGIEKAGELYNAWSPVVKAEKEALKVMGDQEKHLERLIAKTERLSLEEGKRKFGAQYEFKRQGFSAALDEKDAMRERETLLRKKAEQEEILRKGTIAPSGGGIKVGKGGAEYQAEERPGYLTSEAQTARAKLEGIDAQLETVNMRIKEAQTDAKLAAASLEKDRSEKGREQARKIEEIHREEERSRERMAVLADKAKFGS